MQKRVAKTLIKPVEYWCFWTSTVSIFGIPAPPDGAKNPPGIFAPRGGGTIQEMLEVGVQKHQ